MAGEDGRVTIRTLLDDTDLKKGLSGLSGTIKSGISGATKAVGAMMGAATAAVGTFSVAAVNDFISFENRMNEVFTLIPGASQQMKDSMIADTKALAKEMGVLPEEIVPAIYQAISAGIPAENVFDFVKDSTKLAKAGVAELDDSVGVLSTIVNTYAKDGLNAEQASNMLFTAVKLGVTSVPELATNLGKVVPIASSVGFGFDEISASVSTLTAIMGKGSTPQAITNLRGMLAELSQDGSKADEAFRSIAGVGLTQFMEQGGNAEEVMRILQQAAEENDTSINNLFGSIEAGQAALILAGGGFEKFSNDLEANKNSAGATETAFKEMSDSTKFSIDRIKANIATLKLDLAEQFVPAFDGLLDSALEMFDGTEGASAKFAETLTQTLEGVIGQIIPMITELAPELMDGASVVLESLVQGIVDNSDDLSDAAVDIVLSLVDFIAENLPEIAIAAAKIIVKFVEGIVGSIPQIAEAGKKMILGLLDEFIAFYPEYLEAGKNIIIGLGKGIASAASTAVDAAKEAGQKVLKGIKDFFGIRSPSRVMMSIGEFISKGMAIGITNKKGEVLTAAEAQAAGVKDVFLQLSEDGEVIGAATVEGYASAFEGLGDSIKDASKNAFTSFLKGMEDVGEAIAQGEDAWGALGKAALLSVASVVEALGNELAARAVLAAVSFNWVGAGLATAGATAAYVAAGMIKSWANSFAVGGIVPAQSGVSSTGDQTVIYANPGELILNAAQQTNVARQLEALSKINELVGTSSGGALSIGVAFNGPVFGDQEAISRYVYDGIKRAQWEGVLKQW
ncbi:hypothetical protein SDC9_59575 [bioreactor metagenome]|uniref:Phage tail tape measure protein domain-containing protein n=1 Tax=bioreactor metagenome TaxID=1076179 RepID=A0A644XAT5_9ZZZZ